jgi:hypothetical protein
LPILCYFFRNIVLYVLGHTDETLSFSDLVEHKHNNITKLLCTLRSLQIFKINYTIIFFSIHFPLQNPFETFLNDFAFIFPIFQWSRFSFVFFILNFKCNRIGKLSFCMFKRSPLSELVRFSMEVELTHLFNGFKWFWMDLNLDLSNKNNNRQVFNSLHLSSIDVEESQFISTPNTRVGITFNHFWY